MTELNTWIDQPSFMQAGRKGIAYDWQSLLAAEGTEVLELVAVAAE